MVSGIIVAAGQGVRMKNPVRKQYLGLGGRPILAHSLMAFDACDEIESIFLVVPKEDVDYCQKNILPSLELKNKVKIIFGGARRQDSVYFGLQALDKKTNTVVIHDGVRPFIQPEDIAACILGAKDFGACILGIPVSDTLKRVGKSGIIKKTLARDDVWLAQTPQAFQYDLIIKAHKKARWDGYGSTDDASLLERLGINVKVIIGSRSNIKIATLEDLAVARAMLETELD
jgi:2-C-methyl-D-erythritol 4-phosphate cytidylyltransferase